MLDQALKAKLPLALLALLLGGPVTAHTADLYDGPGPYRTSTPYAPPLERCRVFHQVRIDPYGREVLHRVRVCDERIVERAPGWAAGPPRYGYAPQYYDAPRPARNVGPEPEFDDE